MTKEKTNKQKDNHGEILFISSILITVVVMVVISLYTGKVTASPLVHEFKNPSFNGVGASAHYLTIDEQETKRRDELAEKIQSELEEIEREIENSTLNKFLNNLQAVSSVISQGIFQICCLMKMAVLVEQ